MGSIGRVWEGLGVFGCIAAHYSNIVRGCKTPQNRSGIVCMRAGITRRVAGRSGASTGCSGLCPLPIPTHTFPYSPIIYRAASRRSPLSCTMLAAYASVGVAAGFRFTSPTPSIYFCLTGSICFVKILFAATQLSLTTAIRR